MSPVMVIDAVRTRVGPAIGPDDRVIGPDPVLHVAPRARVLDNCSVGGDQS